jgi:hypothetical protein
MSKTAVDVVGELDWSPLADVLTDTGTCTVRFTNTTNGVTVEVLSSNEADKSDFRILSAAHCATCQCNKLNPSVPAPDNPCSKSWHNNAAERPK